MFDQASNGSEGAMEWWWTVSKSDFLDNIISRIRNRKLWIFLGRQEKIGDVNVWLIYYHSYC
jgi:hypothetical protein